MGERSAIIILPAGNASEWTGPTGTNTYLLAGTVPALVDAGIGNPDHIVAVERALDGTALSTILVTHDHPDHAGGIPALLARWPEARVRGAGRHPCVDGELVRAGDGWLRAIHTPGHAPDHFCFLEEGARDVFCGDLARLGGTVAIPVSRGGNLVAYLASLRKVAALGPRRLLPGHGPIVEEPAGLIAEYLAHRAARERQIEEALAAGCTTADLIVVRTYSRLSPALSRAAAETVVAHLQKLSAEGRAVQLNGEWTLADQ
jgi:glyoxylase-like metal-dependent hydrolase (beta-lactamase superfamily II)